MLCSAVDPAISEPEAGLYADTPSFPFVVVETVCRPARRARSFGFGDVLAGAGRRMLLPFAQSPGFEA
jgi:hypothetical protein